MTGKPGSPNESIDIMGAIAVKMALDRWIVPDFEKSGEARLGIIWEPTTVLMRQIVEGKRADVVIIIDEAMDQLEEQGIVQAGTRVEIARAVLGVGIRAGARRPDLSSVEAFRAALINADGVAYSKGGASGIYFAGLIERLGISEAIRPVIIPAGFTAEKVASGEAEIAIQQTSELMSVPGIEIAGLFPDEYQVTTEFSAAIFSGARNPEGAARFLQALTSEQAASAYRNGGLVSRLPSNEIS